MNAIVFVFGGALAMATPLLLAALGELVAEKAGVLNLSIEGMMALAAAVAFLVITSTGSHMLGFVAAAAISMALSLVFAFLVLVLDGNQIASGISTGILGLGLSSLLGRPVEGHTLTPIAKLDLGLLSDIPVLGQILFRQDIVVYLTILLAVALWFFLTRTKAGLILKVIGENPDIARNVGLPVMRMRFLAITFGAALAGCAGAYAVTVLTPVWSEGIIAGRGWIALALVVFGTWQPLRIMLGAYLFGIALLADLAAQSLGVPVPSQILSSLPYVVTILVLVAVSRDAVRIRLNAPASLGKSLKT